MKQLVPILEQWYALRLMFGVQPEQGRIVNWDETMFYLCRTNIKKWH